MTKMTLIKYLPWLVMLCGLGGNALADGLGEPIPSYYEEPGISKTREYINQHGNEHIDPFTGKLQYHFVDAFIPGNGGLDLKVQRSYNSLNDTFTVTPANLEETAVGLGWTMHFGRVLKRATALLCDNINIPSKNAVLEMSDGSRRVLYLALDGVTWITTDFWKAECKLTAPQGLNVYSPDGTRYEMTSTGHSFGPPLNVQNVTNVGRIVDRNGNWLSFTYVYLANGISAVKTVTSSDGRAVTFNYSGSTLSTVTDSANTITYASYTYGTGGGYSLLTKMTRPDGQTWDFAYNTAYPGGNSLRQIKHPTGGVIDYTYGYVQFGIGPSIPQSTVVTQKVATRLDVVSDQVGTPVIGIWTYLYKPTTELLPVSYDSVNDTYYITWTCDSNLAGNAQLDTTVVTGPDGVRTYGNVGFNGVSPGFVAYIGSKACTSHANQVTAQGYSWMTISNQVNIRPGNTTAFDNTVGAILPRYQFIGRSGESFETSLSNYDNYGNPRTISETGNSTKVTNVTYSNVPSKWIIRQKKDETLTEGTESFATTRTFDANGNLLTETHAGVPTSYTYYPTGDVASRTDARLKTTKFSNYRRGIPLSELQPENIAITRVVSDAGNVTSDTDGEGATTSFSYDSLNRVTGITHPVGNPVNVVWGPNSRTVTRGAYVAETTFDGFGREIKSKHIGPQTITQTYKVDALGRRVFASYPNSNMGTKYAFDLLNRVTLVFNEYDPGSDSYASYQSNNYSNFGVRKRNERGIYMNYKYRAYGNPDKTDLIEVSENLQSPNQSNVFFNGDTYTTINRNIAGQMVSVVQDGITRSYSYNSHYYVTSITEPETGVTVMGRDISGNLTSRQVDNSGITTYSYDDRNRLTGITYPAGTPSVLKTYFKDDKLKSIDNGVAKRDYIYDVNKNLTDETLTIGAKVFPLVYGYNANDAHTFIRYGSNKTVTYTPDAFGRPTLAAPYVSTIAYHPSGQASNYTFANGVASTINLNGRQWPNSLKITKTSNLFDMNYEYDYVGNVTSITDNVDSSYNKFLNYDTIDRLIRINGFTESINYNLSGDITAQNQNSGSSNGSLTYQYDEVKRRLLSVSGVQAYAMQYDVYGNTINNGKNVFSYNDASHMKCANCGSSNEVLYEYDGNGIRVKSRKNNTDTFYMYGQSGQLLWEETPNMFLKEYIYLGGKQIATREQILP